MVTRLALALLMLAAGVDAEGLSPTATALSPTAAAALSPSADALLPLPPRPLPPQRQDAPAWEHVTGVIILSTPFTAFWCVLAAVAINSVAHQSVDTHMLQNAGTIAVASSVGIGIASLRWGSSPSKTPQP